MNEKKRVLLDYMRLKYHCKRKNLTITTLAENLGITRQTIRSWSLKPTFLYNVWLLEDALEVKTGELVTTSRMA